MIHALYALDRCWLACISVLPPIIPFKAYMICLQSVSGTSLKKELRQIGDVCLELPGGNSVRTTLEKYKARFEELLEESLNCTS